MRIKDKITRPGGSSRRIRECKTRRGYKTRIVKWGGEEATKEGGYHRRDGIRVKLSSRSKYASAGIFFNSEFRWGR